MARLAWTPKALNELEALISYIERDAPVAARRFAQKIVARVDALLVHPLLGSKVPENDAYRELHQGPYRIIYRVEDDTVWIIAIHHGARLLDGKELDENL